jgi:diacylglycerol kinase family enzyme
VTAVTAAAVEAPPRPQVTPDVARPRLPGLKRRMLIIVNPYATTVSDRLKNLVVYALQGRYDVETVSTKAQNHATEISREVHDGGYDLVVAFGGDGTLNEVANGLAGSEIPVSVLPGGSTNVVCRSLGIPNDVVDATERLLGLADDFRPRRIDLGIANGRRFLFAAGAGLDASAAQRMDARPSLKAHGGRWFYTGIAVDSFYRDYLGDPIRMRLTVGDAEVEGITAIAQNSDPFTYFGNTPVRISEGAAFDDGALSVTLLRRAAQRDVPSIIARALSRRLLITDHRQIEHFTGVDEARIESVSRDSEGRTRLFPVQVDGDYIGDHGELELGIDPGALTVVA